MSDEYGAPTPHENDKGIALFAPLPTFVGLNPLVPLREHIAQAIAYHPMTRGEIAEYVGVDPELVPEPKWPVTNGHRKAADRVIELLRKGEVLP